MMNVVSAFVALNALFLSSLFGSSEGLSPNGYLSSLSSGPQAAMASPSSSPVPFATEIVDITTTFATSIARLVELSHAPISFSHASISYFALDELKSKGPRKNADIGQPHDATRPFVNLGSISSGSWWCSAGGWPSPDERDTTEVFFVLSGRARVIDLDGIRHNFGPGDTVVLPKGWSGRWEILEDIHKVWFVHDHPNIEVTTTPIRAVITPYQNLGPQYDCPLGRTSLPNTASPSSASQRIYNVGPTAVGWWTCSPGSFVVDGMPATESFHLLEGVCFLTNTDDGMSRRCVAGDTVVLPKGWKGYVDIVEAVKKLWVVVK